jgi:hypothetical protein
MALEPWMGTWEQVELGYREAFSKVRMGCHSYAPVSVLGNILVSLHEWESLFLKVHRGSDS